MKIKRKQITNAILLLFAAVMFVFIGYKTDWTSTWNSVKTANVKWLLGGTAFMLLSHIFRGVRWTLLTEPAGYKLNMRRSFLSVMAGYLVNVATSRGGEIARCALTSKSENAPVELLVGTVVTERVVDLIMLFLVCMAALLLQFEYIYTFLNKFIFVPLSRSLTTTHIIVISAVAMILIGAVIFYFRKKDSKPKPENTKGVKGIFLRFAEGLKTVFKLQKPGLFLALSFGIWVGYWLSTFCILQSLEVTQSLTLLNALSVVIFASIGIAIPLPAGAGVWGAVSLGLQTVYGFTPHAAETYGIFTLAFSNLLMIVFGSISYIWLYLEIQKTGKNDLIKNNI